MREALEHHAFALLWPRRTLEFHAAIEARHEALLSAVDRGDTLAQIEAEMQFHCCPYEPADNLLLMGIRDQISARTRLVFTIHRQAFQQGASYRAVHQRYLDLALGGELDAMLEEVTRHLGVGLKNVSRYLAERE